MNLPYRQVNIEKYIKITRRKGKLYAVVAALMIKLAKTRFRHE